SRDRRYASQTPGRPLVSSSSSIPRPPRVPLRGCGSRTWSKSPRRTSSWSQCFGERDERAVDIVSRPEPFDAIVVGSGATGGVAAVQPAASGLKVLVLEAGRMLDGPRVYGSPIANHARRFFRHFVSKRQTVQELHGAYWQVNPDLFVDDIEHPYTT